MIDKIIYKLTPGVRDIYDFFSNTMIDATNAIFLAHAKYYGLDINEYRSLRASNAINVSCAYVPVVWYEEAD